MAFSPSPGPAAHMMCSFSFLMINILIIINSSSLLPLASAAAPLGKWNLLLRSIGISAMHMQLLNDDRVVIFDRTDFGRSNLSLPKGTCRNDANDQTLKHDCTAHSAEYNVLTNSIRPLTIQTDTWCSSGAVSADGNLIQTGGFNDGERVVRIFQPCRTCDWKELRNGLSARRWYATNNILPDGRIIVIGGRQQFNYEYYPKSTASTSKVFPLTFLSQTTDRYEDNLYPYVYLNVDGNLFIFANNRAILFDYARDSVVKTYPEMPDGNPRNYPSTGSSVLLPLKINNNNLSPVAEVLICGGAPRGSIQQANSGKFIGALNTCGRIRITDPKPVWSMETMPLARVMGDMTLLPDGQILIINGAARGTAGWEMGRDPVLHPVLYLPDHVKSSRFQVLNPSTIPRMYHSTAILLRDGRVLVGGSNPHQYYKFTGVLYPTELSLEAFSPPYLDAQHSGLRPTINSPASYAKLRYGERFTVRFSVPNAKVVNTQKIKVTMISPSFTTHSFSMNQRLLILNTRHVIAVTRSSYAVAVMAPNSAFLAPPGYYLLFVVHKAIPSKGIWVQIHH